MRGQILRGVMIVTLAALAAPLLAATPASADEDIWPTLKQTNFGDREIVEGDGKVVLDAPVTAEDPTRPGR